MKQKTVTADEYRLAAIEAACLLHFNIYHALSHEELALAPTHVSKGISVMNEIICRSRRYLLDRLLKDVQVHETVKALLQKMELSKVQNVEFSDILSDAEQLAADERNQLRLDFLDELEATDD